MNHSVAHKETAEPQKIDGQNAAVVEKKSEELEDSKLKVSQLFVLYASRFLSFSAFL